MSMKRSLPEEDYTPVRKKHQITLEAKMHILKEFENGERACDISKKYMMPTSTVRTILKNKDRILSAVKNTTLLYSHNIPKKSELLSEMESILQVWCSDQIRDNIELSKEDVCEQAIELFESLKVKNNDNSNETFVASNSWYSTFKRLCNLDQSRNDQELEGATSAEPSSCAADTKLETQFKPQSNIDILREDIANNYSPQTVFNVCDTAIFWKKLPSDCHLTNCYLYKESKDRLTIMIGGNAAGDFKIKPLCVYHTENPKALNGKSKGGLPVFWKSNPKACMLASVFEDWFGNYFIPSVERYCCSNNIPFKVMLIVASTPAHLPSTLIDFDHRVKVVFLSPDETYSIQPMYQDLVTIFKAEYTHRLLVHLKSCLKQQNMLSVIQAWKKYNILDAIRIIVDSWESINVSDWKKAWGKIFPSVSINETDLAEEEEDNRVSKIVKDIVDLATELELNINESAMYSLLDSHFKELSTEEVTEIQEQNAQEEFESSEALKLNETNNMSTTKMKEALEHIKMGLNILEDLDSNVSRARSTKQEISKLLVPYEEILNAKIKSLETQDEEDEDL